MIGPLNFGQMGTENLPAGNGPAIPYGIAPPTSAAPTDAGASMQGPTSSAVLNIGYHPAAGRADRLAANIVGGAPNKPMGGFSGGATSRM